MHAVCFQVFGHKYHCIVLIIRLPILAHIRIRFLYITNLTLHSTFIILILLSHIFYHFIASVYPLMSLTHSYSM